MTPEINKPNNNTRTADSGESRMGVLKAAIKAVPAVKYALGVAGIMAAAAIGIGFFQSPAAAFLSAGALLILMVLLVVFAAIALPKRVENAGDVSGMGACAPFFGGLADDSHVGIFRPAEKVSGSCWPDSQSDYTSAQQQLARCRESRETSGEGGRPELRWKKSDSGRSRNGGARTTPERPLRR